MERVYYLYRHIRLDTNEVFYIGLGTKLRNYSPSNEYIRAYSKDYRNKFWRSVVNKTKYRVEIIIELDDYELINKKEIEFISLYRRRDTEKGTLCNLNDGGGSNKRLIVSADTRSKQSLARKGIFKMSERHKDILRHLYRGKRLCAEAISKAIKSNSSPVSQYTKEGIWLRDFNTIKEAKEYLKVSSHVGIVHAARGSAKSAHGYIWKYQKIVSK